MTEEETKAVLEIEREIEKLNRTVEDNVTATDSKIQRGRITSLRI
jgi:hypothetical protein